MRAVHLWQAFIYNERMKRTRNNAGASKNGRRMKTKVSKLGRELRRISDKFLESGGKPLNRREIAREVAERRGGR